MNGVYISSALLHDRRPDAGSLARINADDVERLVVAVLGRELSRPELLADGPSADEPFRIAALQPSRASFAAVLGTAIHRILRSAVRYGWTADARLNFVGFRLGRTLTP